MVYSYTKFKGRFKKLLSPLHSGKPTKITGRDNIRNIGQKFRYLELNS